MLELWEIFLWQNPPWEFAQFALWTQFKLPHKQAHKDGETGSLMACKSHSLLLHSLPLHWRKRVAPTRPHLAWMLCILGEDLTFRPTVCFEENVLLSKALMVVPKSSLARCKALRDHLNYFVLFEAINSCWHWFKTEDKLTHCILWGQFIWIILLNWTNYELKQQTWRCKGKESLFFSAYEYRECARQMCETDVL